MTRAGSQRHKNIKNKIGRGRSGRTDHGQQHCYHHIPTVNQRRPLQFTSSWWWARGCPKHVELYLNDEQKIWEIDASGWLIYLNVRRCTDLQTLVFFSLWRCGPTRAIASSFTRFLDHNRHTQSAGLLWTRSARRRDLYLTTHTIHNKHPCPGRIRIPNLSRRAAAALRLRRRGHWTGKRQQISTGITNYVFFYLSVVVQFLLRSL